MIRMLRVKLGKIRSCSQAMHILQFLRVFSCCFGCTSLTTFRFDIRLTYGICAGEIPHQRLSYSRKTTRCQSPLDQVPHVAIFRISFCRLTHEGRICPLPFHKCMHGDDISVTQDATIRRFWKIDHPTPFQAQTRESEFDWWINLLRMKSQFRWNLQSGCSSGSLPVTEWHSANASEAKRIGGRICDTRSNVEK